MKNYKLSIIVICFLNFFAWTVNAQVFVGGDFSFSSSGSKYSRDNPTYTEKSSGLAIDLSPFIGRFITDKLAVGILGNISTSNSTHEFDRTNQTKAFSVGVHPFLRYYLIQWNKFSLFGVGMAGINFSQLKNFNDGAISSKEKGKTFSINFHPGLSYSISDKVSLESEIKLLSLIYNNSSLKSGSSKYHSSNFNLSGGSETGYFSIGAIYKF